VLSCIAKIQVL